MRLVVYKSGKSKGMAYVEFADETSASKALIATDNTQFQGDKPFSTQIMSPCNSLFVAKRSILLPFLQPRYRESIRCRILQ